MAPGLSPSYLAKPLFLHFNRSTIFLLSDVQLTSETAQLSGLGELLKGFMAFGAPCPISRNQKIWVAFSSFALSSGAGYNYTTEPAFFRRIPVVPKSQKWIKHGLSAFRGIRGG